MIVLSGALALAACGGDDPPDSKADGSGPADGGGVDDTGGGNQDGFIPGQDVQSGQDVQAGQDVRDAGSADRADTGGGNLCPRGNEGCACNATGTSTGTLAQDDCASADLRCFPFDLFSGLEVGVELEGPVQSCIKPCTSDADCPGRTCGRLFREATGLPNVCLDRVASWDEACSGSRLAVEQVADPQTMDIAQQIIGCEAGLTCQLGFFGDFFNPDEAFCMEVCENDNDCTHPDLTYCNTRFLTSTSTANPYIGVCATEKLPFGAACGSPDLEKVFRIASACDTSVGTCGVNDAACPICIGFLFDQNTPLQPDRTGFCLSACDAMNPCVDGRTCVLNFFNDGDGACSDECTAAPDTCPGTGVPGAGQDCLGIGNQTESWAFCVDRQLPPLIPATLVAGQISSLGDDCTGDFNAYSFFRCPDGYTCAPQDQGQGFCIAGCDTADPATGAALCQQVTGSATSSCAIQAGTQGLCSEP